MHSGIKYLEKEDHVDKEELCSLCVTSEPVVESNRGREEVNLQSFEFATHTGDTQTMLAMKGEQVAISEKPDTTFRFGSSTKRRSLKKPPPLELADQNVFVSSHNYEPLGTFEVRNTIRGTAAEVEKSSSTHQTLSPQELLTEFEWDNRVFNITQHGIRLSSCVVSFEDLRCSTSNPRKQKKRPLVGSNLHPEQMLAEAFQQSLHISQVDARGLCQYPVSILSLDDQVANDHDAEEMRAKTSEFSRDCNVSELSLCTNTNPNSGYKPRDSFFDHAPGLHSPSMDRISTLNEEKTIEKSNSSGEVPCWSPKELIEEHWCSFPFRSLKIHSSIGIGRTCTVYKAHSVTLGREIAVKVIDVLTSHNQRKSLLKELRVLFYSYYHPHPNIIEFYGACFLDGQVFIGLEYMQLGTLRNILSMKGKIDEEFACCVAFQLISALDYLHRQIRCIHRDIKPGNILFGNKGEVKLCDFGLATKGFSTSGCHRCKKHTFVGTTLYMAPEMLRGEAYDVKIDIWSLGMTIREALSGIHPFRSILEESTGELDLFLRLEAAESSLSCSNYDLKDLANCLLSDWDGTSLSEACIDFLDQCLTLHPENRPTAEALLQHHWFDSLKEEVFLRGIPLKQEMEWTDWVSSMRQIAQEKIAKALDWQEVSHCLRTRSPVLLST
eukprot:jgi/Galph1/1694/GphlegSOOS_G388.1